MERVSILLGHKSIKVTERHYAAWVRARQDQLEADVRKTWDSDAAKPESSQTPSKTAKPAKPAKERARHGHTKKLNVTITA